MQGALLAGTHSGCGKTTIMLALLQYFQHSKHSISAFKAGPDFLDPLWHQAVIGKASYNLDTRMLGKEACRLQLLTQAKSAEIALIEGVMGLFDGIADVGGEGSSVDLAYVLGCPVILVVDAGGMSGSIAAVVSGFVQFALENKVSISGIIANKVGSAYHAELLKAALQDYNLPPLIAWMERNKETLTERHLGLTMPESKAIPDYLAFFHVDHTALIVAFTSIKTDQSVPLQELPRFKGRTVAIARDDACCFIYPANLDWLQSNGAELVFFSPIAGDPIPESADALWLPGGYPELHAQELSQSKTWQSLKEFINANKPVLAECGGAMLLGEAIMDIKGEKWPMAAILPFISVMQPLLVSLGHRTDKSGVRGHEFHYSKRESTLEFTPAFELDRGDCGIRYKNVRASYIHWYFASASDQTADWF
ncbi:MAG: cobyrinate a,c-diamide synthase [Methylococcales bacterium]